LGIIFDNYVIHGVETFCELTQKLVANSNMQKILQKNPSIIRDLCNKIEATSIHFEKNERAMNVLKTLLQDDNLEIEQQNFKILYNAISHIQHNKILLNYICIKSGKGFTITVEQGDNETISKLKELIATINSKNREENCEKFLQLYRPKIKSSIICQDQDKNNITRLLKTMQKLLCNNIKFHEKYLEITVTLAEKMCKFSDYKGDNKLLYGHWLRNIVKNYRKKIFTNKNPELLYIQSISCFKQIVIDKELVVDYSCVGKNEHVKYNLFHEIVLAKEPVFFTLITESPLTFEEKTEIIQLLRDPIKNDDQNAKIDKTTPSPFELLEKQKEEIRERKDFDNLSELDDLKGLMENFYYCEKNR